MAYEQKTNSGALFPNNRKEKETHPDLTGTIDVNGQQFWISAWEKTAKTNGAAWLSLSLKPKDQAGHGGGDSYTRQPSRSWTVKPGTGAPSAPPANTTPAPGADEDVPF